MEIVHSVGLNETEYLKRPEIGLPKSTPEIKKKRVVSQKQLDSLKKAREASVEKRKIIKEQKIRDKEMAREAKVMAKKEKKESPPKIMETVEEEDRASTPEELIDMDSGFNYDRVVSSVYDMIQAEKASRKPAKEAKWNKRFSDEEHIRIDERNKLLDLVKQMEEGEKKAKKKAVKAPFDANHYLSNNRPSRDINWDNCFSPRRGGNNFF